MVKLILRKAPHLINSVTDVSLVNKQPQQIDLSHKTNLIIPQESQTPLMIACKKKFAACVKLLVENDANISAKDCVSDFQV